MKRSLFFLLALTLVLAGCGSTAKKHTAKPDPRKGYFHPQDVEKINAGLAKYDTAYDDNSSADKIDGCNKTKPPAALNACFYALRQEMQTSTAQLDKDAKDLVAKDGFNQTCSSSLDAYSSMTSSLAAIWVKSANGWKGAKVNYDVANKIDQKAFDLIAKYKQSRTALAKACLNEADQKAAEKKLADARKGYLLPTDFDAVNAKLTATDAAIAKLQTLASCNGRGSQAAVSSCVLKVTRPLANATRALSDAVRAMDTSNVNDGCKAAYIAYAAYTGNLADAWANDVRVWARPVVTQQAANASAKRTDSLDPQLKKQTERISAACISGPDRVAHL